MGDASIQASYLLVFGKRSCCTGVRYSHVRQAVQFVSVGPSLRLDDEMVAVTYPFECIEVLAEIPRVQ